MIVEGRLWIGLWKVETVDRIMDGRERLWIRLRRVETVDRITEHRDCG